LNADRIDSKTQTKSNSFCTSPANPEGNQTLHRTTAGFYNKLDNRTVSGQNINTGDGVKAPWRAPIGRTTGIMDVGGVDAYGRFRDKG
jgi:hypothetical protein